MLGKGNGIVPLRLRYLILAVIGAVMWMFVAGRFSKQSG